MGIYFWLSLLLFNTGLNVRALVRSAREGFRVGVLAAVVLSVAVALAFVALLAVYFPGLMGPAPWLPWLMLIILPSMPVASLTALFLAYLRMRDVPAAEEEKASRPFDAWLPVGIVDGILVTIAIGTMVLS